MDRILDWYPNHDADLARVRRFWAGEGRALVTVLPSEHYYRQTFDDEIILDRAPKYLFRQSQLPGLNLPALDADFGTISTAKYWGGRPRFDSTGGNIFIDPVARTLDDALALRPRPLDDPEMDAAHGLRLFHALSKELGTDRLWLCSPDMEGPLNTAGLVLDQEELLMGFYSEPEKVHRFLEIVTSFLIEYARHLRRETGNRVCGNIWPHTFLPPEIGVSFTEDLMPLLSAPIYEEFGLPCLRRMAKALGGLHIHCCGDFGRHVPALLRSDLPLLAYEFHYPFTQVEELLPLAERGTVLVPCIVLHKQSVFADPVPYYRHLLTTTSKKVRYWFFFDETLPGGLEFATELMAE